LFEIDREEKLERFELLVPIDGDAHLDLIAAGGEQKFLDQG